MHNVSMDAVIKHLTQLRATLVHALTHQNISAKRFNEIRSQLLPLDEQLRGLGVDLEPTPQMSSTYVRLSRHDRRMRQRANKFDTIEQRIKRKAERNRQQRDDE